MPQLLVIVRDQNGNVVAGAAASSTYASGSAAGTTDKSGTVTLTFPDSLLNQIVMVTASAAGFSAGSSPVTLTQYASTLTLQLTSTQTALSRVMTVTDGANPIAGAQIYVNGGSPVTTSSTGTATVTLKAGSNTLQVSAAGFQSETDTIDSSGSENLIVLTASTTSTSQHLTLVSSPPAATLQIGSEGGLLGPDGTYTTTQAYPPGQYTITLTSGTRTSTTMVTVVAGTSTYQLSPITVTDSGSGASLQTVPTSGAAPAAPTASSPSTPATANQAAASSSASGIVVVDPNAVPNYEFVNPTGNFGRYFTATQARMYIGNLFIEELAGVQFVLQGNKVPVYGYASEAFDAIGNGKYLVQGQLMIHFISEGYLYTVLNEYKRGAAQQSAADLQALQNLVATEKQLLATKPLTGAVVSQIGAIRQQRQQLLAGNANLASNYKRSLLANSTTTVGPNAVYRKTPFDIVLELEGGGRTVTRRISNCVLTSNEQIYGDNDTPLIDSYGFIARSLPR
jgi:hypothetical protein